MVTVNYCNDFTGRVLFPVSEFLHEERKYQKVKQEKVLSTREWNEKKGGVEGLENCCLYMDFYILEK